MTEVPREEMDRWLDGPLTRGELKRVALRLEASAELRQQVIDLARGRGRLVPPEAGTWPGKQLLRRLRGREEEAQTVETPTERDDGFLCARCGLVVVPNGRSPRDHCPACLWSQHVDVVPGDRAATCQGALRPVGAEQKAGNWVIVYRCEVCGQQRRNRATLSGTQPDAWEVLVRVAAQGALDR